MIRIFKYDTPTEYKDFENYVFTSLSSQYFDIPNDKVTIDAVDYRISTAFLISEITEDDSGQSGVALIVLSFEDYITKVFFDELEIGKGYVFTYDLVGNGLRQFVFMANSENSSTGTYGINIHATIDGRILMEYYDENNNEIINEIVFVLAGGSQTTDPLVIESGDNTDTLILS